MKPFIFKTDEIYFECALDYPVEIVKGDSGTGKTYIYKVIDIYATEQSLKGKYECSYPLERVKILLNAFSVNQLQSLNGYIIFIDRGDMLLTPELIDYINKDSQNYYVITARNIDGLNVFINAIKEMHYKVKDNKISLVIN